VKLSFIASLIVTGTVKVPPSRPSFTLVIAGRLACGVALTAAFGLLGEICADDAVDAEGFSWHPAIEINAAVANI